MNEKTKNVLLIIFAVIFAGLLVWQGINLIQKNKANNANKQAMHDAQIVNQTLQNIASYIVQQASSCQGMNVTYGDTSVVLVNPACKS